jgi:Zn2+/Cd2+-exporting ATPase
MRLPRSIMIHHREISIPLPAAPDTGRSPCTDLLRHVLEAEPGVRGALLDTTRGRLCLRYDPHVVSLHRVQQLIRRLGIELGRQYERCELRLRGVCCADCALEGNLARLPGITRVSANPATGTLAVEYDAGTTSLETVEEVIDRAVSSAREPPRSQATRRPDRTEEARDLRRMAGLTGVCFAAWLLGLAGEFTGLLVGPPVLAVYLVAYIAGGSSSAVRALRELRAGSVGVDLLMVVAALGAATVGEWPEGAFLLFLFSLSNTLERYVLGRTRRAIEALLELSPDEAVVRRDGAEQRIPVAELRPGDVLIVRPAERIAADGVIVSGSTAVDQSAMTGESMPVERGVGDAVFAGTLNQQGAIEVEVASLAGESTLARVVRLVEQAQSEKAQSQRFTEWFGTRYTLCVLGLATLLLAVPVLLFAEPFGPAFYRAMTVLVAVSPCAVVISIPAAILTAITSAARGGVLFKGGAHLERAATLRAVAFDKTGTLTVGRPRLVDLRAAGAVEPDELLRLAAAAESLSEHPLAGAVVEAARDRGLELPAASDLEALIGRGVRARVGERWVWVGKREISAPQRCGFPEDLAGAADGWAAAGNTVLFVADDERVLGALAVADTLRPSAPEALDRLRALGIEHLVMLTGDNRAVAQAIAGRLGITFEAELLPEDKLRAVRRLRERYGAVAMVGDGINDAPSLAAASLGVSLGGTGTDVALETADVVLMADDLRQLPYAIALARQAGRVIRQNLVFAFAVIALLLAGTLFGSLRLPVAVLGHEGSTVLVILNGLRLLAFGRPSGPGRQTGGGRSMVGTDALLSVPSST